MRPDPRAVMFDLDDTLYPQRRFVLSGFAAVALHLEAEHQVPATAGFAALRRAFAGAARGRELQACLRQFGLPVDRTGSLIEIMRTHRPALRLPRDSREVLRRLRPDWRLGVVTNGDPDIQLRKIAALGLRPFVDVVICAVQHGSGAGKPDPEPFIAGLAQLGVAPQRAVFVGDSERCDIAGAAAAGLWPVRIDRTPVIAGAPSAAAAVLRSVRGVPAAAARLVGPAWSRDVV